MVVQIIASLTEYYIVGERSLESDLLICLIGEQVWCQGICNRFLLPLWQQLHHENES